MLQSPGEQSQTDSAFDEMMSSMHSNDLDRDISNQVSLCNTLEDDFPDEPLVQATETSYESDLKIQDPLETEEEEIVTEIIEVDVDMPVEYAPELPSSPPQLIDMVEEEEDDEVDYEVPIMSPPETPRPTMERTLSPLNTPRGPRDTDSIVRKARNFSDIITEPPKVTIKALTKEVSDEKLRMMDNKRKAIIQQSMRGGTFDGSMSSSEEEEEEKEIEQNDENEEEQIQQEEDDGKPIST